MLLTEYLTDRSRASRDAFAKRAGVSTPTLDAALAGSGISVRSARHISRATKGAVPVVSLLGLTEKERAA